ncbi:MAG: cell division protein FtsL [Lachnospiraceae bacterium]|nr:cell division protein FtsL [Lachnospiraceae bacterium]
MAGRRKQSRQREYVYVQGNNVLSPVPTREEIVEDIRKQAREQERVRRNRERASRVSFGYVLFIGVAFFVMSMVLIGYLDLRADIVSRTQTIASLKTDLNSLKLENDEKYERLTTRVDLSEIRRVAENELNMSYAGQGQIQMFSGDKSDYVHQITELPDKKKK